MQFIEQSPICDGAVRLAMNAPERRNALDVESFDAFDEAIDQLKDRTDIRVVTLSGYGSSFCAGFDLRKARDDQALLATLIQRLSTTCRGLRRLPQVVIGDISGYALAGGCALVCACDIVVADKTAKFGYPVHRVGLSPAVSAPLLTQALVGGPSRQWLMGGDLFEASMAHEHGLVHHLVEDQQMSTTHVQTLVAKLCSHGPQALAITKRWMNELDGSDDDAAFQPVADATATATSDEQTAALLDAFWEAKDKRSSR